MIEWVPQVYHYKMNTFKQYYDHLATSNLPIMFDLDIDVYEMGSSASKAQTVFATAPRIKLL